MEKSRKEENDTCQTNDVQSVFVSILKAKGLDERDKKAAIIDFIAAGIRTVSEWMSERTSTSRISREFINIIIIIIIALSVGEYTIILKIFESMARVNILKQHAT